LEITNEKISRMHAALNLAKKFTGYPKKYSLTTQFSLNY